MSSVRFFLSLLPILARANPLLARAPRCNADDCARAVTGTSPGARPPIATRSADCSSFQLVTVTPVTTTTVTSFTSTAIVITTSTESTTVATTVYGGLPQKRQAADTTTITNSPTAVPAYASACAGTARYSSACLCLSITRTTSTAPTSTATVVVNTVTTISSTTTTTVTSTTTAVGTIPTLCGNAGTAWALWRDNSNVDYPFYDPTQHKSETPITTGVTSNAFLGRGASTLYGSSISSFNDQFGNPTFLAFTQRGYIFAAETGTYTLQSNDIDDFLFVWIGPQAYSGWNRNDALLRANVNTPASSNFATINLVAGNYYPLRIYFKQYGGPASLQLTVKSPSGAAVISPASSDNQLLVQYSCDGVSAPQYPPFGQET